MIIEDIIDFLDIGDKDLYHPHNKDDARMKNDILY